MSEVLDKKWYVVRAVSGQENKIKGYIETEVARLGFEDYLEEGTCLFSRLYYDQSQPWR